MISCSNIGSYCLVAQQLWQMNHMFHLLCRIRTGICAVTTNLSTPILEQFICAYRSLELDNVCLILQIICIILLQVFVQSQCRLPLVPSKHFSKFLLAVCASQILFLLSVMLFMSSDSFCLQLFGQIPSSFPRMLCTFQSPSNIPRYFHSLFDVAFRRVNPCKNWMTHLSLACDCLPVPKDEDVWPSVYGYRIYSYIYRAMWFASNCYASARPSMLFSLFSQFVSFMSDEYEL